MEEKKEVRSVSFHCSPIIEMHWAPSSFKVPILLSVNSEELIWWNVAPLIIEPIQRQSRMGRSISMQSVPSPRSSFKMKNSQSSESKLSMTKGANGMNGVNVNNNINGKTINGDNTSGNNTSGNNINGTNINGKTINKDINGKNINRDINGKNINEDNASGKNINGNNNGKNINGENTGGININGKNINGNNINGNNINGSNNNVTNTNGIGNGSSNNNGTTLQRVDLAKYFWETKVEKVENSALLCLVPLPLGNAKVCVSDDFNKFLTVDNNGYVSTFEPFGILDIV